MCVIVKEKFEDSELVGFRRYSVNVKVVSLFMFYIFVIIIFMFIGWKN